MALSLTQRRLARRQLDALLEQMTALKRLRRPPKGWVRAIRDSLGMSEAQLAERMKLSQPAVAMLEKSEAAGTTTIATLERAAAALGCRLVYALVPENSLDEMVRQQAHGAAVRQVGSTAHTMELEKQGLPVKRLKQEVRRVADELARVEPRSLWRTS